MMKRIVVISLIILLPILTWAGEDKEKDRALAAANIWLALLDGGEYDQSWQDASALFKSSITKPQWRHMVMIIREPFDAPVDRTMKSSRYVTSLPGAPEGAYVMIQFLSEFENVDEAVETVTLVKEEDGEWRVFVYKIN